jgi:hypothetical protein
MEHIGSAIFSLLKTMDLDPRLERSLVMSSWETCAGELLAKQTKAKEYFDNVLTIAVKDETWRRHLSDLTPQLIAKLNHHIGEGTVRFIDILIEPELIPEAESGTEPRAEESRLIPEKTRSVAESIEDADLREAFLKFSARIDRLRTKGID